MAQFEGVALWLVQAHVDLLAQSLGVAPRRARPASTLRETRRVGSERLLVVAVRYCETHQTVFSRQPELLAHLRALSLCHHE